MRRTSPLLVLVLAGCVGGDSEYRSAYGFFTGLLGDLVAFGLRLGAAVLVAVLIFVFLLGLILGRSGRRGRSRGD